MCISQTVKLSLTLVVFMAVVANINSTSKLNIAISAA